MDLLKRGRSSTEISPKMTEIYLKTVISDLSDQVFPNFQAYLQIDFWNGWLKVWNQLYIKLYILHFIIPSLVVYSTQKNFLNRSLAALALSSVIIKSLLVAKKVVNKTIINKKGKKKHTINGPKHIESCFGPFFPIPSIATTACRSELLWRGCVCWLRCDVATLRWLRRDVAGYAGFVVTWLCCAASSGFIVV